MKTYIIEGGVGKHIAFTSLIGDLARRDKSPIQVHTPYVDVFAGNPDVQLALDSSTLPLNDSRILSSDDIVYVEPYKSSWVRGEEHVIDAYARLLGLKKPKAFKPQMYTEYLGEAADKVLGDVNAPFIVIQLNGGQTPIGFNTNNQYQSNNPGRNYPHYLGQQLVNLLKKKLPDVTILNWSLPNEPQFDGATPLDVPYSLMHELSKHSLGFIGVDSSLMHIAKAVEKTGVFIWGNTSIAQFGYSENSNLTFHQVQYDLRDVRNIMVDPEIIVKTFLDTHYAG